MSDVVVLMLTCDKRKAAWPIFHHSFQKYWPDCPWPLVVKGDRKKWSDTAIEAVYGTKVPIVLMMLEDHWLTDPVDTDTLMDFAEHVRRGRADHIRLWAGKLQHLGPLPEDDRLTVTHPRARYRACMQSGLWATKELLSLLEWGETAWEFEWRSAKRTKGSLKYLCVRSNIYFPYTMGPEWGWGVIRRGEWTEGAKRYAEREGLEVDFRRGVGG